MAFKSIQWYLPQIERQGFISNWPLILTKVIRKSLEPPPHLSPSCLSEIEISPLQGQQWQLRLWAVQEVTVEWGRPRERKVLIAANRSLITLCSALLSPSCLLGLSAFRDIFTCCGLEGLQCLILVHSFTFILSLFWLSQCGIVILYAGHLTHQTVPHPNILDTDCPLQPPLIRREKELFWSNMLDLRGCYSVFLFFFFFLLRHLAHTPLSLVTSASASYPLIWGSAGRKITWWKRMETCIKV